MRPTGRFKQMRQCLPLFNAFRFEAEHRPMPFTRCEWRLERSRQPVNITCERIDIYPIERSIRFIRPLTIFRLSNLVVPLRSFPSALSGFLNPELPVFPPGSVQLLPSHPGWRTSFDANFPGYPVHGGMTAQAIASFTVSPNTARYAGARPFSWFNDRRCIARVGEQLDRQR